MSAPDFVYLLKLPFNPPEIPSCESNIFRTKGFPGILQESAEKTAGRCWPTDATGAMLFCALA
jgi:hypothetical protein